MPDAPNPSSSVEFADVLTSGLNCDDHIFLVELSKDKEPVSQQKLPPQGLVMFLSGAAFNPTHHYYITANTFQKDGTRTAAFLQSLNAFVVDIDCHGENIRPALRDFRIDYLAHLMKHDIADGMLPIPNVIVRSGRGLQVWWLLQRMEATEDAVRQWQTTASALTQTLSRTLLRGVYNKDDMYCLKGLSVDSAASAQPNGDFRLPGSINPNAETAVRAEIVSRQRYALSDFVLPTVVMPPFKPAAAARSIPAQRIINWTITKLKKVEELRKLRNAPPGAEMRDLFCFVYLSLLKNLPITEDEIKQRIHAFNQGFAVPMTPSEMKSALVAPWQRHYRLSTEKILWFLEVDDQENLAIGFQQSTDPNPGSDSKQRRTNRNSEIARLYLQGKKVKEIASTLGITEKTVRTEIRRQNLPSPKDRILQLHQQGMSNADIAAKIPCSLRTVQNTIKKWRDTHAKNDNSAYSNGGESIGKDSMDIAPPLSPALELLKQELCSRYGQHMSKKAFDQHFSLALQRLYTTPTVEEIKTEFAKPFPPEKDRVYRNLLNIN